MKIQSRIWIMVCVLSIFVSKTDHILTFYLFIYLVFCPFLYLKRTTFFSRPPYLWKYKIKTFFLYIFPTVEMGREKPNLLCKASRMKYESEVPGSWPSSMGQRSKELHNSGRFANSHSKFLYSRRKVWLVGTLLSSERC